MKLVIVHAAKSNLSKLIEKASKREGVVIAGGSNPVMKLEPVRRPEAKRKVRSLKGRLVVPDDFMEPIASVEFDAGINCGMNSAVKDALTPRWFLDIVESNARLSLGLRHNKG